MLANRNFKAVKRHNARIFSPSLTGCLGLVLSFLILSCHSGDGSSSLFDSAKTFLECNGESYSGAAYDDCLRRVEREILLDRYEEQIDRDVQSQQTKLASLMPQTTGMVYNVRSGKFDSSCLSEEDGKWFLRTCNAIALGQQFYIGDRQRVSYWLKKDSQGQPIMIDAIAFRLEVRSSVDDWFQLSSCEEGESAEKDGCVDVDDSRSLEDAQSRYVQCLSVSKEESKSGEILTTDCLSASYFIALPSKFGTNEALEAESAADLRYDQKSNRYVSLVAIVDDETNAKIMTVNGELIDSQSQDGNDEGGLDENQIDCDLLFESGDYLEYSKEELEILCPDSTFEKKAELVVDISEAFMPTDDCRYLMHIQGAKVDQELKAICPADGQSIADQQNKVSETHMFLDTCSLGLFSQDAQCINQHAIKKLYNHFDELENGYITQVTKADDPSKCARLEEDNRVIFVDCAEGKNDDLETQFRVINMAHKTDGFGFSELNGDSHSSSEQLKISMVKLQSIARPNLCIYIDGESALSCDSLNPFPGPGVYEINPASSALNDSTSFNPFLLHHCSSVSSHSENNRYDCRYEVPQKLKRWAKLGFGLSFLGLISLPAILIAPELSVAAVSLIASIPSFVFDGLVCNSGEQNIRLSGCIGLGVGLGVEVGFFSFSLRTLKNIPSRYFTWMIFKPSLANFTESVSYFAGVDNLMAVIEAANLSKLSKAFSYMASRMARSAGKGAAESAADSLPELMYGSFVNTVKREKYSYAQFEEVLQKMWDGAKGACGRISCRHPLSYFPKPSEFRRFIKQELVEKTLPRMGFSDAEEQSLRILLSPDSSDSAIETARSAL